MFRTVAVITLFLGLFGLGAFLLDKQLEQFEKEREQHQAYVIELQNRLTAQEFATEDAAFKNVENHRLFQTVTEAARAATPGAPLHTLVNSRQLKTLRKPDYEKIVATLETRTPLDAMNFLMETYKLSENEAETLAELLGRRETRHQDAPGTSLPTLERFKQLTLGPEGLDDIALGVSAETASDRLGVPLDSATWQYGDEDCASRAFGYNEFEWLLRFILKGGNVGKIDIFGPGIPTDRGVEVGTPMQEVFDTYPEGELGRAHEPNERLWMVDLGNNHYLEFRGGFAPHDATLDRETVSGAVRSISLGRYGVGSVEGCL